MAPSQMTIKFVNSSSFGTCNTVVLHGQLSEPPELFKVTVQLEYFDYD